MSNVIDELKVVFTAETGALMSGLSHIGAQLGTIQGMSGAAQASLRALATAFGSGLSTMSGDAYNAGSNAGAAFAKGLRSQAGNVKSAAKYISAQAVTSLGGSYSGGSAGASGFGASTMGGGSESGSANMMRTSEVVVPLNVDGVKLGEACIRAMDRVSGMTGRAHVVI